MRAVSALAAGGPYSRFSITAKLIIILIGISGIAHAGMILFLRSYTYSRFVSELEEKGASVARNLASGVVEPVLLEDPVKLQRMVSSAKELETDVVYVYLLDGNKNSMIHTFPGRFPGGLAGANPVSGGSRRIQLLSTESGYVRDIGYPVLDGLLGSVHVGVSEERIQSSVSALLGRVTFMFVLLSGFGLSVIYFLSKKTLVPLTRLLSAVRKVGEGDLNQRIEVGTRDELGALAMTFNEMTEKLRNINLELEKAQAKLLQAAKMTTAGQFSAGIAHEINNPLAGVLNCIRTLLANPEVKGQSRGYMELSLKGLIRIENIIKQVLGAGGEIRFEPKMLDVKIPLEESVSLSMPRLCGRDIRLEKNIPAGSMGVFGDSLLLQQVFLNIINNAVDAMDSGGSLAVAVRPARKNSEVEITFSDTGEGVKKQDIEKIFDPFFTTKAVGKGVGLGLFLSYNYIQKHNGSISMESIEGRGSTVSVALPANPGNA